MNTKLTLSLEEKVISEAKSIAKKNGKSLSGLIEDYLKVLIRQKDVSQEISPEVKRLVGRIKPVGENYKDAVADEIFNKYQK
jgi:Family of unknown function (DUF6364)